MKGQGNGTVTVGGSLMIKVAFFQRCIPHYRVGIFGKLQERTDISVTVCASESVQKQDFLQTVHKDKGFPFVNVKTFQVPIFSTGNSITIQPYAIWCVLTRRYDVVIMPDDFLDISVWLALLWGRLLRVPVCLFGHGRSKSLVRLSYVLRGILMRLTRAGINYSEGSREEWIKRGVKPEKLFVAYNALDTNQSEALRKSITDEELIEFQKDKGLLGKKTVIFCGRMIKEWKKPHILVLAMKQVVQQVPDAKAVIIGDGPAREEIEELVQQLDMNKYIDVVGPIFAEDILAKYMLSSKVQVIPGNAGLGIQHAFAYSVPFITSDNLQNQTPEIEMIENGINGYLCRDDDIDDFAEKIQLVLCDEQLQDRLAKEAYSVIKEKHNIQKQAEGFWDAIDHCKTI